MRWRSLLSSTRRRGRDVPGYRMARLPSWLSLGSLVLLLAILGWYQYRWTGEVSRAERDRMRAALTTVLEAYAHDFDRELTRLALVFGGTAAALDGTDLARGLAAAQERWEETATDPRLLRGVWIARTEESGGATLHRFDPATEGLTTTAWPPAFAPVRVGIKTLARAVRSEPPVEVRVRWPIPLAAEVPALILPIDVLEGVMERLGRVRSEARDEPRLTLRFRPSFLILELDLAHLRDVYFPGLARRYNLTGETSSYKIAIVDEAGERIYGTESTRPVGSHPADGSTELFHLLAPPEAEDIWRELRGSGPRGPSLHLGVVAPRDGDGEDVAFRGEGPGIGPRMAWIQRLTRGPGGRRSGWRILAFHREGSLAAVVSQARTRNLLVIAVSLAFLTASVAFLVASNRRARRLALQQMDFVALMTHELRTPLATIRSLAENLTHGIVPGEDQARRYGEMIVHQERRLARLVEGVLDFAGMGLAPSSWSREPVDVRKIVTDAIEETQPLFADADASLDTDLPPRACLVRANPEALSRALQNLLSNAVKFGGPRPAVTLRLDGAETDSDVRISVRDDGQGIPADDLPHVFEPFFRSAAARAAKLPGNGLGLSLVQRIVAAHDGHVDVDSCPGEGARFTVHLPKVPEAGP